MFEDEDDFHDEIWLKVLQYILKKADAPESFIFPFFFHQKGIEGG